ncbi:MAG: aminotransferase class I/II-fold pyridoxal phosphate-dependent enzyme [Fusobacterium sp. JB021]|nr:aminotransferase class I/II-fold pyridoxal phosphate-dependent enzyme [Fusobacterium sp. JB020]MDP0493095.1 aminotransferase class I/II-fold pyridoxal phosphate-dependent enzyme [Fusobacterium sp. JB021]MDP0507527.1 aminotransferase class I/II-fold pyridoxal phosphate-dependent enzyme [Fusobacterium sp. JB019]
MLAKKIIGKKLGKGAFAMARQVKELKKTIDNSQIINSTIGTFFDDKENLLIFDTVDKLYKQLPAIDIFGYAAGVSGSLEYKEAVKKDILNNHIDEFNKNNTYVDVTATAGGTGAIHNTFKGYAEEGDTILLPNFMWEAYISLTQADNLNYETYNLFSNNSFNLKDFSEKLLTLIKKQKKVIIVINDPCQNPTGYSLSFEEWKSVVEILKKASSYGEIILLNDIAYIDYDFRGRDLSRKHFSLFSGLPKNILVILAYSMSKSFTCYGLRTGAQIAISTSKEVISEFSYSSEFLCRTSWSNISKGGMAILNEIFNNDSYYNEIDTTRKKWIDLLKERSNIFIKNANKENLEYCPFKGGFFITIPISENKDEIVKFLVNNNIFVLPLKNGIRIALCSVPSEKLKKLPKEIKKAIQYFKK